MLTDTVFVLINVNHRSYILRRIFQIDYTSQINIYKFYKYLSKVVFQNVKMSKDDKVHDLVESPSTSGSSPGRWNCNQSSVNNSIFVQHLSDNSETKTEQHVPNVLFTHPIMSLQSVATNIFNKNFCHASDPYHVGGYYEQQNFSRYYRQTNTEHQINSVDPRNDERLSSLRKWENFASGKKNNKPGFIFTLMCYNVLSQDLLVQHPYLYSHHNNESLQWSIRWNNIFNEIMKFKPDILCLQEVQESHINNYFSILKTVGYSSLYKRRTGERTDGCALYYKTDIVELVDHTSVEYLQPNIPILNRDNVGLIAKFCPKLHPTREFVVTTTHLLYNPRRQDVRLAQMQLLLTEIERISYNQKSESNYLPVIMTGDLNSSPDSPIYEFIVKGRLRYEDLSPKSLKQGTNTFTGKLLVPAELGITDNCQHAGLLELRSKNDTSKSEESSVINLFHSERSNGKHDNNKNADPKLFSTGTLSHNFGFKSVYSHGTPENNEGTTFQGSWVTVDYIFYSTKKDDVHTEDKLKLLARYRLPTKDELQGINIPNSVVGSDHLSLLAKFKLEY